MKATYVFLSLLASLSIALPSGSPICEMENEFRYAHGPESDAGYSAIVNEKGGKYRIKLNHKQTPIVGVLLYITGSDKKTHLGEFTLKTGFQYVDNGCTGSEGSTITHSNSEVKKDTEFIWEAPSGEKGPFTLNAIVSGGRTPWQSLRAQFNSIDDYAKQQVAPAAATKTTAKTNAAQTKTTSTVPYKTTRATHTAISTTVNDDECIEGEITVTETEYIDEYEEPQTNPKNIAMNGETQNSHGFYSIISLFLALFIM